mmetsp:Transcript_163271/g.313612  ORF Transcript_163271/g.313612 Transcript_163271/m.313612 type:complete len:115 (-) Transcript_163271:761-1105(-)
MPRNIYTAMQEYSTVYIPALPASVIIFPAEDAKAVTTATNVAYAHVFNKFLDGFRLSQKPLRDSAVSSRSGMALDVVVFSGSVRAHDAVGSSDIAEANLSKRGAESEEDAAIAR